MSPTHVDELRGSLRAEPCACGGWVAADPDYPMQGMQAHQEGEQHRGWIGAGMDALALRALEANLLPQPIFIILGPVPCHDCGRLLVYGHTAYTRLEKLAPIWRNVDGHRHDCELERPNAIAASMTPLLSDDVRICGEQRRDAGVEMPVQIVGWNGLWR